MLLFSHPSISLPDDQHSPLWCNHQAARAEGRSIPWAMDTTSSAFEGLHALMMACLRSNRDTRPTIAVVIDRLHELREAHRAQIVIPPSS